MSYSLPFQQGAKIVELGGGPGGSAMFHPNVDMRPGPGVDIVCDLGATLPLEDNAWDGVFCKFMIEHVSWRKIRSFISESFRILAPGGTAVFITANLLEQCRKVANAAFFYDDLVGMLFGDQNYSGDDWKANAHYCGFSPEFAGKMFKEAGFDKVIMLPWPASNCDLIIEATKPMSQNRKLLFDKHYFHGGKKIGGYPNEGYRDFPANWATFEKVMALKPESVLELGCARGYLVKRFEDAGIKAFGVDISHHANLTRVTKEVMEFDVCDQWPFGSKSFDLCFSKGLLEHIPEANIPHVMKEMDRVCKRGLHGMVLDGQNDSTDMTRVTIKSESWWQKTLPKGHQACSKPLLETPKTTWLDCIPEGDEKLKVNIGSYITMFYHGWVNIDIMDMKDFAKQNYYKFFQKDVREGLPFGDNSVDLMYSSFFLEHLSYDEAKKFLAECKRVMKPGAVFRIIVTDTELLMSLYALRQLNGLHEINDGAEAAPSDAGRLWAFMFDGHKAAYDFETFENFAKEFGFSKAEKMSFRKGQPQILAETIDLQPEISLFVELTK